MMLNHGDTSRSKYFKFDLSTMSLAAHYFWIVPKGRPTPYWKIFLFHFDLPTWVLITLFLVLSSVTWYYSEKKKLVYSILLHYQMFFESANLRLVKIHKTSTRFLTAASLFSFLIISSVFKSEMLRSFTTHSYEYPIDSLDDIITNNLDCYVTEDMKEFYQSTNDSHSRYVSNCFLLDEDDNHQDIFTQIAFKQNAAVISRILMFKFAADRLYQLGFKETPMHPIQKQVKFDFTYIYVTKGYPLYDSFLEMVGRMHSSGFTMLFRQQVFYKINKNLKRNEKMYSKDITFEHTSVAFYVLLAGHTVATLVFFFEIRNSS
jgi:hypothetical protein